MRAMRRSEYTAFLATLKDRITAARLGAARAVNQELVRLYWDVGRAIVRKQTTRGWGEAVVETLAKDLQAAFPDTRGFSARNLRDMKRFYVAYSDPQFWRQAVAKLPRTTNTAVGSIRKNVAATSGRRMGHTGAPVSDDSPPPPLAQVPWGHHLLLLNKVLTPAECLYYLCTTAQLGWSRSVLLNQINAGAWQRAITERKIHNFHRALPPRLAEQADEALKSRYNLDFLGVGRALRERELERRLIDRLRDFILELGYGFCFIGRQYRLTIGRHEFFVDLLFYHRFLKSLVAVELKLGPFEPEFAGKMDFYLNLLNKTERAPDDNPSVGIILCADKDDLVVEFSLKTKGNPIGVAEYHLVRNLPRAFHGKLPTARALRRVIADA
jgi:predicted nuclease of restriction endonuclease-like (RecB) superfamily